MDGQQFDRITKALATGQSRRALGKVVAGGVGAGLLALLGVDGAEAAHCRPPRVTCGRRRSARCCASGQVCQHGNCVASCAPDCAGKCGGAADGCGGTCNADCTGGQVCQNGGCVTPCVPDCAGKCGGAANGCGGTCDGGCAGGQVCCGLVCSSLDTNDHCGACDTVCSSCAGGGSASCQTTVAGQRFCGGGGYCHNCTYDNQCVVDGDPNVYRCVETGDIGCGSGIHTLCTVSC